ncbi:MAG: hypothetical protein ACYS4W_06080 [Planctomycetota bacterium]|jgi:hypothetical protein
MSEQSWKKIVCFAFSVIPWCLLLYYAVFYLPRSMLIPAFILGIVLYPVACLPIAFPRYMLKILGKVFRLDVQEWKKSPDRYFFLRKEAKKLRSLTQGEIVSVGVTFSNGVSSYIQSPLLVEGFKEFLGGTIIFGLGQSVGHFKIEIDTNTESFSYEAAVLSAYKDDVILQFPECGDYGGIRLCGLKLWLDRNILKKEFDN